MHDLSLYLLELLENSVRAGARRIDVELLMDHSADELRLAVDDDGRGLSATEGETLDPFYTTKPGKKTGLGLSLLRADAEAAEGELVVGSSSRLRGTRVETFMRLGHVDRPPLGDMATTILVSTLTNPDVEFTVSLSGDQFIPPLERANPAEAAARLRREQQELPGETQAKGSNEYDR
jgi:signal transduction histidine kinase